jgi:nitroreductase
MSTSTSVFSELPAFNYSEPADSTDSAEFERVIRSRRSTRNFTAEKIPEEVMRRCLELALLAPNSSNMQPWEFYWVRDPEKKRQLVRLCFDQPAARTAQELVVSVARLDTWRRNRRMMLDLLSKSSSSVPPAIMRYYERLIPWAFWHGPFYLLGYLKRLTLNIMALRGPMVRGPSSKSDMRVWAHKSTALACENLMLSLRAFGFDSCPIEGMDGPRVRRLLELPSAAEICMVISAGKRAENGIYGPQLRFDKSYFLFEV